LRYARGAGGGDGGAALHVYRRVDPIAIDLVIGIGEGDDPERKAGAAIPKLGHGPRMRAQHDGSSRARHGYDASVEPLSTTMIRSTREGSH
jgi:hypothetical protein